MKLLVGFVSAVLFALGLGVSGMTLPENIIGFLDIFGDWKPALMLVMVGAIIVHTISYRLIMRRDSPVLDSEFYVPTKKDIDSRLIVGSIIFGVGWGLGGFCPGPALVAIPSMGSSVLLFVVSMLVGMALFHYIAKPILGRFEK
ncbi:DUF6691 family protein [Pseudobacteriovorax antillogorgiicola]|uniref:Sulphur transport domain-containing protein n=1 Tax=Pseudobacteriovorax antillogorgiicola TaxID=1513793 RepID=A0A1Y6BLA3_9BACT|nr:DUF6691 family protein [Pseudobacteriovorax antillogorgiicola]TCS54705.1 hypothetical protein EDD56_106218 [Pseudobacteriovorax antillogorgiicola]SMF16263.1 hypothetical protein SAMN06296036_10625 [Pseudobacteriovorax antillogorgiicola]